MPQQELVREYLILVAQLETQANAGKLTLQKMWFYVQPTMRTMRVLSELVAEVPTPNLQDSKSKLQTLHPTPYTLNAKP